MTGPRSAVTAPPIRIASYNIHACIGRDGRFLPERIVEVLDSLKADYIALQEVEDRIHKRHTVTEFLAGELGMHAYRGATLRRGEAHYGNLLLSRDEASSYRLHDISLRSREPRGVIEADFVRGTRTLRLFVTHLGLSAAERRLQMRRLLGELRRDGAEIRVLAGDINEWRPGAAVRRLLGRVVGRQPRPPTFPAAAPIFSLDRICVMPADIVASVRAVKTPIARQASDHLPLVAEIRT